MTETVVEILLAGQQRAKLAGSPYIDMNHVKSDQLDALVEDALVFLRTREGKPSSIPGWKRVAGSRAGLLPYWASLAGWTTEEEKKPFRPLRRDVYDVLGQRGLISKPPGQGAAVEVSPANFAPVGPELVQRVADLVLRIRVETSLEAGEYAAVGTSGDPKAALLALLTSATTGSVTRALSDLGRLDLSIEQASLDWADLALAQPVIENARDRLAYWRSS